MISWREIIGVSVIVGGVDYAHAMLLHFHDAATIAGVCASVDVGITAGWGALVYAALVWARRS